MPPPVLSPEARAAARAELKARVRDAVYAILGAGRVPSERALRDLVPRVGAHLLIALRDELREEGEVPSWREGRNLARASDGLTGATEAERDEIAARARAVREETLAALAGGELRIKCECEPGPPRVHRYLGRRERGRAYS